MARATNPRALGPDVTADRSVSTEESELIARGIASAVAPQGGLEAAQVSLLGAIADALLDIHVDFAELDPLEADELAEAISAHGPEFRTRVVHHMVLGELILRPIPPEVARRVATYADALEVDDQFVRVARRYAQGAFGLAWLDLHRSGFAEHWEMVRTDQLKTNVKLADQLSAGVEDPELAEHWTAFERLPSGTLGREVWEMYRGRGFALPGSVGGASAYLAQHDFVHVLADYGTNLDGELEVFALIGRADPDPKGFAWLATLVGLFETGYVADAGFFSGDVHERHLESPAMHVRIADALRRGRDLCDRVGTDLLEIDYHDFVDSQIDEVRAELGFDEKSANAAAAGSPGAFDLAGMSRLQREFAASLDTSS
ncbi:MAG: ubiquinone biosynthesis protein COQ4 [Acidimicrobiia bacterium]|nr:ubiquinone biosynthesis protein COQ4 [Acidimicrobiia bacterium]